MNRRPSMEALKQARDGHLRYGKLSPLRPIALVTVDPVTGHTYREVPGMGTVEYAPNGCTCDECAGRVR